MDMLMISSKIIFMSVLGLSQTIYQNLLETVKITEFFYVFEGNLYVVEYRVIS